MAGGTEAPTVEGPYDVGALYHPTIGGDAWRECIDGEPAIGGYGAPPDRSTVAHHVDQLSTHGIGHVVVPFSSASDADRVVELFARAPTGPIGIEFAYDPEPALGDDDQLDADLSAIRDHVQEIPTYTTYDDRPVVSLQNLSEWRDGIVLHRGLTSTFDEPSEFVNVVREGLTLPDGTPPYLVGDLVRFPAGQRAELPDTYLEFASRFDAVANLVWMPERDTDWSEAAERLAEYLVAGRLFADDHDVDFVPVVYPGWNRKTNTCWDTTEVIPRDPAHLLAMLRTAGAFGTIDHVRIDSFNGWTRGTQIEPGELAGKSYGTAYLESVLTFQSTAGDRDAVRYYVSADGADSNPGTRDRPMATIQRAVTLARAGDVIEVLPGHYQGEIRTVRSGEPDAPITIAGPTDAVVRATPETSDLIRIEHSHVHVVGMTLTGLFDPDAPETPDSYAGNIVEIVPPRSSDEYLQDVVFRPDRVGHVRRAFISVIRSHDVDVGAFEVIGLAGARSFLGDVAGHNAEIVYVGTAPANLEQDWYPWEGVDETHDVRVHHIDASTGHPHTEIVDVKLGCSDVTVEYCTSVDARLSTDNDNGSAVHIGGTAVTFRWNRIQSAGFNGIDVGNYGPYNEHVPHPDAPYAGAENLIYGNEILGSGADAINYTGEVGPDDQRIVCGNVIDTATQGDPSKECPADVPRGKGIGHTGGDSPWA